MIPLKIETLLEGRVVEHDRVEYKTGWNPNDIIHITLDLLNGLILSVLPQAKLKEENIAIEELGNCLRRLIYLRKKVQCPNQCPN
jgi:hypothetical protein